MSVCVCVCMWWKAVVLLVFGLIFNTSCCGGSLKPPPSTQEARENVVLFLEGTAACQLKGELEPERVLISAITREHVTALAQGSNGVDRKSKELSLPFFSD